MVLDSHKNSVFCCFLFPCCILLKLYNRFKYLNWFEEGFKLKLLGEGNLNPSHCYRFDASASSRCPEPGEGSQINRRAVEGLHKGTPASKSASSGA